METDFVITVSDKGKYLYFKGDDPGEAIWHRLNESASIYKDHENYQYLLDQAKAQRFPAEWLMDELHCTLVLNTDFAMGLQRLDAIYPRSFASKNKIGEAIIDVLESGDLCLLLYERTWVGTEKLSLSFELCHLDHRFTLQGKITAGKIH